MSDQRSIFNNSSPVLLLSDAADNDDDDDDAHAHAHVFINAYARTWSTDPLCFYELWSAYALAHGHRLCAFMNYGVLMHSCTWSTDPLCIC